MKTSTSWKHWAIVALGILAVACSLWHLYVADRGTTRESDLLAPYVAARIGLTGGNSYALTTTQEIQRRYYGHVLGPNERKDQQAFAYPLFTVYLVAPFAALPWNAARILFVTLAIPLVAGSTLIWLRLLGIAMPQQQAALCVLFTFASWPVIIALRQQQLTLLLFFLLTGGMYARMRDQHITAGVLLGLCIIKPQLSLLALIWVAVTAIHARQRRLLASMAATFLLLLVSVELLNPGWLRQWVHVLGQYRQYTDSHLAMQLWFGNRAGAIVLASIAATVCVALWQMRDMETRRAVPLVLALTVTLCPTTPHWIYNQILLLPACLLLTFDMQPTRASTVLRRLALILLGWGFLAVALAILGEVFLGRSSTFDLLPYANYLLPPVLTAAVAAGSLWQQPHYTASSAREEIAESILCV